MMNISIKSALLMYIYCDRIMFMFKTTMYTNLILKLNFD